MKIKSLSACFILFVFVGVGNTAEIDFETLKNAAGAEAQSQFETLSIDLGRIIHLNPGNSPEPRGWSGFSAGIEISLVEIDKGPIENALGEKVSLSTAPVPKIRLQKGLPWGIDVGFVFLPSLPPANAGMFGGEIKYDLMELLPIPVPILHIAPRVAYTKMAGINDIDIKTLSYDLSAGVNLPLLAPYAGAGVINITSTPTGDAELLFTKVEKTESVFFAGLKIKLIPLIPFNLEFESSGAGSTYSIRTGVEF